MPIYKLETMREWTKRCNYAAGDAFVTMVVWAKHPEHARQIARQHSGDEGPEAWVHESTEVLELNLDEWRGRLLGRTS